MHKNTLFRGATRPAMFLGVPYTPFIIVSGGILLMSMWLQNLFLLLLLPAAIFIMAQMAKRDEMVFRLLGLRLLARMHTRNIREHDGMWVYSPNPYRDKPAPPPK